MRFCHNVANSLAHAGVCFQRLGVEFDSYEGESQYQGAAARIVQDLDDRNMLLTRE